MHRLRAARLSLQGAHIARGEEAGLVKNSAEQFKCYHQSFSILQGKGHFRWRNRVESCYSSLHIVHALQNGRRERALDLLWNFGGKGTHINRNDFIYILDYCARAPDPMFVMEVWKFMMDKEIFVDKICSKLIVEALGKGGYVEEAFSWLTCLGRNDHISAFLPMYNVLLNSCGRTQNFSCASKCLELMEHQLVGKSEITYWELIKLAVIQNNLPSVQEIWKDLVTYYNPNIITLHKFVWAFSRLGDLKSAYKCLEYMIKLTSQGNYANLSAVKYQASKLDIPIPLNYGLYNGRFEQKVHELQDIIGNSHIFKECFGVDSVKGTLTVICKGANHISWNGPHNSNTFVVPCATAVSGFQKSLDKPISFAYGSVNTKSANRFNIANEEAHITIDNMNQHGLISGVLSGTTKEKTSSLLILSFNDMLHACARLGNSELAEHLFKEMRDLGLDPSSFTYDGFVKAVIKRKEVVYCLELIDDMERMGMKPYDSTLATVSMYLSKDFKLRLAETLLERISSSLQEHIHSFNAFFSACHVMDEAECALRMLSKMKCLNIKPNRRTYATLFSLFGSINVPYEQGNVLSHIDVTKRVKSIELDMMKNGIQHSYLSLKKLIKALGAEGMIQEMFQYLNMAENMLWDMNLYRRTAVYNIVLHSLIKAKESHMAIKIFKNMRASGLPANIATCNIMIECCNLLPCLKSAHGVVSLMLRDGFYPQKVTYTALVKVLSRVDDFKSILNLLELSRIEGICHDIQFFNTILRGAFIKGQIEVIELMVEHIRRMALQPDPSTCSYVVSAYVEAGFYSTAIQALQVLSMRMISEDCRTVQEKKDAFGDLVYSEDPDTESLIIELFKKSQEFLATALLNLRMCAINGSLISWCPDENPWSRRLSSSYDATRSSTGTWKIT